MLGLQAWGSSVLEKGRSAKARYTWEGNVRNEVEDVFAPTQELTVRGPTGSTGSFCFLSIGPQAGSEDGARSALACESQCPTGKT
jgi:hypothetical protein